MKGHTKHMWDEKKLLYRVQVHKDADAYATIYDLYIEKIYRFVLFKISNVQEAEDITSDTFLKTWQYLTRRKRNIKSISGLLYKIARNAVIDAYRNKGKNETYSIEHAHTLPCKANQDAIEVKQEVDALLISIKRLKQEYQEAVLLRYVEELSIAEVAEIVGKSNASVRVLLHRAIKKLHSIHEE